MVKGKLSAEDQLLFEEFVLFIRAHGSPKKYKKSTYVHFDTGGKSYWTMGAPLDQTIIINRHELGFYDLISDRYDRIFSDAASTRENDEIFAMIDEYCRGEILDIGCGTGLLLDMNPLADWRYTGVDPSAKMIERLNAKHPAAETVVATFEEFQTKRSFDFVASLFGSISYINPAYFPRIKDLLASGGKYFLMFFKNDYFPVTYQRTGVCFSHYKTDPEQLKNLFDYTFEYSNYVVATNI